MRKLFFIFWLFTFGFLPAQAQKGHFSDDFISELKNKLDLSNDQLKSIQSVFTANIEKLDSIFIKNLELEMEFRKSISEELEIFEKKVFTVLNKTQVKEFKEIIAERESRLSFEDYDPFFEMTKYNFWDIDSDEIEISERYFEKPPDISDQDVKLFSEATRLSNNIFLKNEDLFFDIGIPVFPEFNPAIDFFLLENRIIEIIKTINLSEDQSTKIDLIILDNKKNMFEIGKKEFDRLRETARNIEEIIIKSDGQLSKILDEKQYIKFRQLQALKFRGHAFKTDR